MGPEGEDLNVNPGGNSGPAAGGGEPGAGGPAGSAGDSPPETVSREEHDAVVQQLNDNLSLMRTQLDLLQRGGGRQEPAAQDRGFFGDQDDEDVPTVGELRKFEQHLRTQFGGALGEVRASSQTSDYQEVVKTHLPNFLRENPLYINVLNSTPPQLRAQVAYDLGTRDPAYQAKQNQKHLEQGANPNAQRIVDNKGKPQPGGKGGGSPLSKASYYEALDMGDELEKRISEVLRGVVQ
ncbi:MAG: hypothetical protein C4524_07350 [Candidatus Zixiibacteriota bacterium]|nr:MAG: hypothetical protein C4524_07350 [candidate division Zixibacteria bacterium]